MKKMLMALLMVSMAGPALGQESNLRTKFYDFGEQLIDGTTKIPTGTWVQSDKRPEFESLLEWKKSFMDEIKESSKDRGLR